MGQPPQLPAAAYLQIPTLGDRKRPAIECSEAGAACGETLPSFN